MKGTFNVTHSFNHKLNTIKWIGILTMTIDHVGYFLFPGLIILRMIGRIAFPCFLYAIIEGTEKTSNYKKYISRLLLLGVISMPITPNTINVLFLLALFSLSLKYRSYIWLFAILSIVTEYSIYGFLFGWAIYWLKEKDKLQGVGLSILVQFLYGLSIQFFAILSLPLFLSKLEYKLPKLPKYFFYVYYPAHQLLLIIVVNALSG